MQLRAPIPRHAPLRAGCRLICGMRVRPHKLGAVAKLFGPVVVEPIFAGFKALEDGMRRLLIVGSSMPCGRCVAAAFMPALRAPPKMEPPASALKAFYTTIAARRDTRIDAGRAAFFRGARFVGDHV